jgi:hypothetical protein
MDPLKLDLNRARQPSHSPRIGGTRFSTRNFFFAILILQIGPEDSDLCRFDAFAAVFWVYCRLLPLLLAADRACLIVVGADGILLSADW